MAYNNRGRQRSSAQRAGMSAAGEQSNYLTLEQIPQAQRFVDSNYNVIDTYYGGNPTLSDVNLLLQTEDEIRAFEMAKVHNAYTNRLNPVIYAETQVDTNPFAPFNYPSNANGYGRLGGYDGPGTRPIYENERNSSKISMTCKAGKCGSQVRKAIRQYIKDNNINN